MKTTFLSILFVSSGLALGACGGSSTTTPDDAAVTTGGGDMTSTSAPLADIETCAASDYVDARTDATKREFTVWDTSFGTKCLHISAGQTVTWDGVPTAVHPLAAHGNGTTPNPITNVSVNTFPTAGTYGFWCTVHQTLMHGAIWVE